MRLTKTSFLTFAAFYGMALAVQFGGAYFTATSVQDWYLTLERSPLNPPGPVFGIAWTILYFLMALAATRAYPHTKANRGPLVWWGVQLLLGFLWCVLFFGMRDTLGGLIVIICTTIAVIVTAVRFWRLDSLAGGLMAPLLLWLTLATHLNLYIYLNN